MEKADPRPIFRALQSSGSRIQIRDQSEDILPVERPQIPHPTLDALHTAQLPKFIAVFVVHRMLDSHRCSIPSYEVAQTKLGHRPEKKPRLRQSSLLVQLLGQLNPIHSIP